ncbi:MAG: hypothetical protein ACRD2Z_12045 [Thermoanaerobaculia bacterium]
MRATRPVLTAGLAAGTLDLIAAIVTSAYYGRSPSWLLKLIASGFFGSAAFDGGASTAALGVVFHFVIATGAAAVYYAASRRWPVLTTRPLACGAAFGIAVWVFMNLVVLPFSAYPFPSSFRAVGVIRGLLIHIFCVGLPIALVVRRVR